MAYELPPLPYAYDALEPHIDARTMEIHHTRHHQTYIDKLNAALADKPELSAKPIQELMKDFAEVPAELSTPVRNHGGGHANHSLFWTILSPDGGGEPKGPLADAINSSFGSFDQFKTLFTNTAVNQFGSGWAWLVLDGSQLAVTSTPNQDSPISQGKMPLLGNDVWEHAYYLKYQNRRPDYLAAWWNVVNWPVVAERYSSARSTAAAV
jgi:Fe-Mn family superoxide dismutase